MIVQLIQKDNNVEILADVVVPKKFYKRIDLGVQILNEMFGGQEMPGILPGSSMLFTGTPGAGKSTMALQLADLFTKHAGRNVLYNIGEENRYMIKMRSDRIGLAGSFCVSQFDQVDELIRFCDDMGVEVLFQDSLQTLRDGDLSGDAKLRSITRKLQSWKGTSDVTLIIIGQSTKSGHFAGPNEIKHNLDVHAHLKIDTESGGRILELEKNRFGPATIPYQFSISNAGLDFKQVKVGDDDGGDDDGSPSAGTSRAADRRGRIVALIKEKMLAGEKISGYCFERFEVECSGGFWRGMLSRACKELQAEGHKIEDVRIDGRIHSMIGK